MTVNITITNAFCMEIDVFIPIDILRLIVNTKKIVFDRVMMLQKYKVQCVSVI